MNFNSSTYHDTYTREANRKYLNSVESLEPFRDRATCPGLNFMTGQSSCDQRPIIHQSYWGKYDFEITDDSLAP